jgi:hypothetical protein
MAAKLTRLTHKTAIQLYLVAESFTICSSRSRRPVRKILGTHSYARMIRWLRTWCFMLSQISWSLCVFCLTQVIIFGSFRLKNILQLSLQGWKKHSVSLKISSCECYYLQKLSRHHNAGILYNDAKRRDACSTCTRYRIYSSTRRVRLGLLLPLWLSQFPLSTKISFTSHKRQFHLLPKQEL